MSVVLLAALVYKFCADGREREKQAEAQNPSEDGYSVEEWKRIRQRGTPPRPAAAPRAPELLAGENEPPPITHPPAGRVRPPSPTWGQLAHRLICATVILTCYLVLALSVSAVFLPYYRLQTSYEPTRATVLENAVAHQTIQGKDWYSPCLRLRYQAGDVTCEQWCGLDNSHFYRSIEHPTTQSGSQWLPDRARAEKKLPYPVGGVVPVWYLPSQPQQVVVPDSGVISGAVILSAAAGAISLVFFAVPAVGLFRKAWNHRFVFRHTTGRVLGGEVRSNSAEGARRRYYAVLFVQRNSSGAALTIDWGRFSEKPTAAGEVEQMLAAHPSDQTTPVWFDPAGRYPPTFQSFGFLRAFVEMAALIVWAPTALISLPFQVAARIARR